MAPALAAAAAQQPGLLEVACQEAACARAWAAAREVLQALHAHVLAATSSPSCPVGARGGLAEEAAAVDAAAAAAAAAAPAQLPSEATVLRSLLRCLEEELAVRQRQQQQQGRQQEQQQQGRQAGEAPDAGPEALYDDLAR